MNENKVVLDETLYDSVKEEERFGEMKVEGIPASINIQVKHYSIGVKC